MLFEKKDKKIYFVHIPRTGGRMVKALLFSNNFKTNHVYGEYKGVENLHLHCELLKDIKEYTDNLKFTIMRNPYRRLRSILSMIRKHNTERDLEKLLNSLANKNFNNWLMPQSNFIDKECKVWKYEKGFKQDFINWLNDNFNLNVVYHKVGYKIFDYDNYFLLDQTTDMNKLTEKLYKKDIELYETIK
mgnify:CR=1 FL=1|tara:strand:+ start:30 stop:593 length:564 start_codon:yes stop_codon:yes gene_type:complete